MAVRSKSIFEALSCGNTVKGFLSFFLIFQFVIELFG